MLARRRKDKAEAQRRRDGAEQAHPPPVFCSKSLDLLDCKRVEFFWNEPFEAQGRKEFVTVSRDGTVSCGLNLPRRCRATDGERRAPPGSSDEYQNKAVAEKAIRKSMKTKARQNTAGNTLCREERK